jgi:hypothetical protein
MTRRLRYLSDLTPAMRSALLRCYTQSVLVRDPAGIADVTLQALLRHTLIASSQDKRAREVYKPSVRGLAIITADEPRLLARASDAIYTTEPGQSMFPDAGEAVDDRTQERLARDGRERDHARQAGVDDQLLVRLDALRCQRRDLAAVAMARGLDVRDELRFIDRAQNGIERKIRQQLTNARQATAA